MRQMLVVGFLFGHITFLTAITYEGPVMIARFSEQEANGLGYIREGAGHGPLRLVASDTALYLLSRLDHHAYTFDLSGNLVDSIYLPFCPADMACDPSGRLCFLQHRVKPCFVSVYKGQAEVERREFDLPDNRLVTELCFSPSGERLLLSGGLAYRLVAGENRDVLFVVGERPGRFHLLDTHIGWLVGSPEIEFSAKTTSGQVPPSRFEPMERELFQFHTDDRAGRIYITGTSVQLDEEGKKYVSRRLLVVADGKLVTQLDGIEAGHPSYDFSNHDIAVAPNGDIYLWRTHFGEGYSEILRWKLRER